MIAAFSRISRDGAPPKLFQSFTNTTTEELMNIAALVNDWYSIFLRTYANIKVVRQ